jgi:single-strand DNA-binding protein
MYLNKAFLYGNLTRDPELKALPGGQQVASFGIATNRTFTNKEGAKQEQTEFHNIVAFGRTAEVMGQYLKKGRPVYIEGRIQTRSWETEGKKNYKTEIVVDTFQFGPQAGGASAGGDRSYGDQAAGSTPAPQSSGEPIQYPDEEINPEDIPF